MITTFSRVRPTADTALVKDQLQCLQTMHANHGVAQFCQAMIWVLKKKAEATKKLESTLKAKGAWNKKLVPFKLNRMQLDLLINIAIKNLVLKQRQGGLTTFMALLRVLIPCLLVPGSNGLVVSQSNVKAAEHFAIIQRAIRYFGKADPFNDENPNNDLWASLRDNLLHLKYSPRRELYFDMLDSRLSAVSAANSEQGQGITVEHILASEYARWPRDPQETLNNIKGALVDEGTLDIESTADGIGGDFHSEYKLAKNSPELSEFKIHFYQWWWSEEYTAKNPVDSSTLTEEESELIKQFHLDLKQIAWRRVTKIAFKRDFDEKYPESDVSAFLTSGYKFFDTTPLYMQRLRLENQKLLGYKELPDGYIKIYKRRVPNRMYLGAGDMARGIEVSGNNTDFCAACFIDVETGEDVATIRARMAPEEFGEIMVEVAKLFNDAMLAVERTGDGHSCMLAFKQAGYGNVYMHREWDKQNKEVYHIPGWPATTVTRPIALNRLKAWLKENEHLVNDKQFLDEAQTFIRNSKSGKPEAATGEHDDSVTAMYVAQYCRLVALGFIDPVSAHRERYGDEDVEVA